MDLPSVLGWKAVAPELRRIRTLSTAAWDASASETSATNRAVRNSSQLFLTCQVVRFYSHVICPLYITKPEHGGKEAKPPIQEHSSLPA
jgi:hypothetical protein